MTGIKKSLKKKKGKEKETSGGLESTTSYLTATGPSLTIQNFCIKQMHFFFWINNKISIIKKTQVYRECTWIRVHE